MTPTPHLTHFRRALLSGLVLLLALLAAQACGTEESGPTTQGLFQLQAGADADLYIVPFPNQLRVTAQGTLDLARLAKGQPALIQRYLDELAKNTLGGFALNAGAYFRFDAPIDPACLPASAADTVKPGAQVRWLNIDKASPDYGKAIPVEVRFSETEGLYIGGNNLSVLPIAGMTLRPATTYAVLLTDGICDLQGGPVQPAADFTLMLKDETPEADPHRRAHATFAPLRAFLKEQGLTGLIAAAVFKTGRPTAIAEEARRAVLALAAPTGDKLEATGDLASAYEIHGTYSAPNFQSGTAPYMDPKDGGDIKTDSTGKPQIARTESMRFALSIPKGTMPASGWPVVLYAHGTGGSYRSFVEDGTADRLAEVKDSSGKVLANLAVVSIDQVLHGPRGGSSASPESTFFNVLNPAASVHNVVQAGIDNFSLLRMITGLTATSIPWKKGYIRTGSLTFSPALKFDASKVYFLGHSQGGLTGPVALAFESGFKGAVLSGAGGGAIQSLLEKTEPSSLKSVMELAVKEKVDRFHPLLNLIQQLLEPADPLNYARLLQREPPQGQTPRHLLLTEGIVDHYTPNVTTEALALAVNVPLVGTVYRPVPALDQFGVKAVTGPVAGNISTSSGSVTGGLCQFKARTASPAKTCKSDADCEDGDYCSSGQCLEDGHFVIFRVNDAIQVYTRFLGTLARDGLPVIQP